MNEPNPELLRAYGTNDVFEKKAESALPLAARVAIGLLNAKITHDELEQMRLNKLEQQAERLLLAEAEKEHMRPNEERMRFSQPRAMIAARLPTMHGERVGDGGLDPNMIPVGMDLGMVRLASIASEAGRMMAKEAGIMANLAGRVEGALARRAAGKAAETATKAVQAAPKKPIIGWQGKLVGGALLAGGAYGAHKAVKKGLDWMGQEPPPANYNQGGYQVPNGVNYYGYPDLGAP